MNGGEMRHLTLTSLLLCSCGARAEPYAIDTGLPSGEALSELTDSQEASACRAVFYVGEQLLNRWDTPESHCTVAALRDALDGDAEPFEDHCAALRDECIEFYAGSPPSSAYLLSLSPSCRRGQMEPCSATVDDYERCFTAYFAHANKVLQGVASCDVTRKQAERAVWESLFLCEGELFAGRAECDAFLTCGTPRYLPPL